MFHARWHPSAVAAVLIFGCAGAHEETIGITNPATGGAPPAPPSASVAPPPWAHAKAAVAWPRSNAKRFLSNGHWFGRYDADIHVNDVARAAYATVRPGASLPVGSIVAEKMIGHDGTPGPTFAMEKDASGWTYVEADGAGRLLRRGKLTPCIECHGHVASQDELFGVPVNGR